MHKFYVTGILVLLLLGAVAGGGTSYIYANGQRVAKVNESGVFYFHSDNLGSTSAVTNSDGEVVEKQVNLPFGEPISGSEKYGFTGKEHDETELQYFGARYYDPLLGRFLSIDPLKYGKNWYNYANNNPLKFTDPDGCKPHDDKKLEKYRYMNADKFRKMFIGYKWNSEFKKTFRWFKRKKESDEDDITDDVTERLANGIFRVFPTKLDYFIEKGLPALQEIADAYYSNFDRPGCLTISVLASRHLMRKAEIEAWIVFGLINYIDEDGNRNRIAHIWNLVNIEGHLMDVDLTEGQFAVEQMNQKNLRPGPNTGIVIIPHTESRKIGNYEKMSIDPGYAMIIGKGEMMTIPIGIIYSLDIKSLYPRIYDYIFEDFFTIDNVDELNKFNNKMLEGSDKRDD